MDRYPFRSWDDNLKHTTIKALMYLENHNGLDIALADTLLAQKQHNYYNTARWQSRRIFIDIHMALKDFDL